MAKKEFLDKSGLERLIGLIKSKFAELVHSHTLKDITDYKVETELSLQSENPLQTKVITSEINAINDIVSKKSQVQIITWEAND